MAADGIQTQESDWTYLKRLLKTRTVDPLSELPFLIYVFLGIILFGGLGIWTELLKYILSDCADLTGLITAIMTFFPTLVGATSIQLILKAADDKIMVSFALLILCCFLAAAILLPFFSPAHPGGALVIAALLSVGAVWVWWFTNSEDPTFRKKQPPDAPTGGPVDKPMSGDLTGFQVS